MKENYQWKVLLKTSATEEGEYLHVPHPHVKSFPAGHTPHQRGFDGRSSSVSPNASNDDPEGRNDEAADDDHQSHHLGGYLDHDLFVLAWGPTIAALSFVFDKSEGLSTIVFVHCRIFATPRFFILDGNGNKIWSQRTENHII